LQSCLLSFASNLHSYILLFGLNGIFTILFNPSLLFCNCAYHDFDYMRQTHFSIQTPKENMVPNKITCLMHGTTVDKFLLDARQFYSWPYFYSFAGMDQKFLRYNLHFNTQLLCPLRNFQILDQILQLGIINPT
jgi:hypothetical protein